jgi:hypothetical protein
MKTHAAANKTAFAMLSTRSMSDTTAIGSFLMQAVSRLNAARKHRKMPLQHFHSALPAPLAAFSAASAAGMAAARDSRSSAQAAKNEQKWSNAGRAGWNASSTA